MDGRMRHIGGTVELDGEEMPIGDDRRMNAFRFHEVSLIPQYSMSALNPTRKIGKMVAELLHSRGSPWTPGSCAGASTRWGSRTRCWTATRSSCPAA
nr:hypothetical protein GCM10020093_070900 [Planobispora longispora]